MDDQWKYKYKSNLSPDKNRFTLQYLGMMKCSLYLVIYACCWCYTPLIFTLTRALTKIFYYLLCTDINGSQNMWGDFMCSPIGTYGLTPKCYHIFSGVSDMHAVCLVLELLSIFKVLYDYWTAHKHFTLISLQVSFFFHHGFLEHPV